MRRDENTIIIDESHIFPSKTVGCDVSDDTKVLQGCWEVGMQLQLPHSMLSLIKDLIELQKIHATAHEKSHWSKPSSTTKNFGSIGEARGRMPGQEIVNTNYNRIPNINDNTDYEDRRRLYIHFSKVGAESQTV